MGVYVPALRTYNFRCSHIVFIQRQVELLGSFLSQAINGGLFYVFRIVIMASVITLMVSMIRTTMPGRFNQMRGKLQCPWFSQEWPAFQCRNVKPGSDKQGVQLCLQRNMTARAIFKWSFQPWSLMCGSMGMHVLSAPYLSITWATWVGTSLEITNYSPHIHIWHCTLTQSCDLKGLTQLLTLNAVNLSPLKVPIIVVIMFPVELLV